MKNISFGFLFLILTNFCAAQQTSIDINNIKKHVEYLSSDKMMGRGTSGEGERLAGTYIVKQFKSLNLIPKGESDTYYQQIKFKYNPMPDSVGVEPADRTANNIIGYLDNGAAHTIVIGAHYDHLGLGFDGNSLDANPQNKIHNGADDNASGIAGVLELANFYSKNNRKENYNFLFICFSAEELGLYGSKKFCEKPTIDLLNVNYMINMDMIGRLNDSTKKMVIYGVGTAPDFVPIINNTPSVLQIKQDSSGIGPSDQTSFYLKNIPVLHFFTGQHKDYHKPSDDADKINYAGEKLVLEYIVQVIEQTEKLPKLKFLTTRTPSSDSHKYKVTLGVMPDYTYEGGNGMRIDGVTDGKPASKAGIQKGDVIMQLADDKITDVMSYMKALSKHKKGDTVTVKILRDGKETELKVTF
jgi:hypothetical protein